ncbi:flagellar motor protein MotB [Egicoccus sp. AB-alg6-2]|uniref:flagellar motor protein MotB n=1 Tax=Egicoccus sp. AB-alg6-2 TaxID=3242692 RepID=UPI00359D7B3C
MARPKKKKEEGGGDRWLGTYGDMITLLLAFFVMLYSMSTVDVLKFASFVQGLAVPFGNNSAEGMMPDNSGLLPDHNGLDEQQRAAIDQMVETVTSQQDTERSKQLDEIAEAMQEALEEAGLDALVEQRREARGLVISVGTDDVLFGLGSTEVGPQGREILGAIADILADFPNDVMIEGYTDDLPLARPGYDNWNLSTDRSIAVLKLMVQEHGLSPAKIGATGYGEFRPLVPNTSPANRAKNRRVDIAVLLTEEETA